MSWWLAAGLKTLRSQINAEYRGRDVASDGAIGDAAHQANPSSDHNPDSTSTPPGVVRAIDVDEDLLGPGVAAGERLLMRLFDHLRLEAKAGRERRLYYLIYEGRITSAKSGWEWRTYTGVNPHRFHGHVSVNSRADHDGSPWSFPEDDMPLSDDDVKRIAEATRQSVGTSLNWFKDNFFVPIKAAVLQPGVAADVDEGAIADAIVEQLGPDLAKQVADTLAARLKA